MLHRLLGSAAAVLSAAVAAAADPLPLPPVTFAPQQPPTISVVPTDSATSAPKVRPSQGPTNYNATVPGLATKPKPATTQPLAPPRVSMVDYTPIGKPAAQPPAVLPLQQPAPQAMPTITVQPPADTAKKEPMPGANPMPMTNPTMGTGTTGTALDGLCCPPAEPVNNYWAQVGYTMMWIKPSPLPPALAMTNATGTGGQVILGGSNTNYGSFDGVFARGGVWINEQQTIGLDLAGFITGTNSTQESVGSSPTGSPRIVRPFFNPNLGRFGGPDAIVVSSPDQASGQLTVDTRAQISGGEINLLVNMARSKTGSLNLVAGFRYFDLDESLTITQQSTGLGTNTIPFFGPNRVNSVVITDEFQTRNQFYGGQFGLDGERRMGVFWMGGGVDVGFGPVHQITEINGTTVGPTGAGGPGGLLAVGLTQPGNLPQGNLGRTTTNYFAVMCDANLMAGVQLGERFRAGIGYNFMYLSSVARPGRQIAANIDGRLIPVSPTYNGLLLGGATAPPVNPIDRDDFYAHGVRFLIEFDF